MIVRTGHIDRAAVHAVAAEDIFDHSGRGQDRTGILTAQVNSAAVPALPNIGIVGDAADRAADAYAAAVDVDRAAVYIFNFRTIFHLEIGTLQPDRTGGADGASVCAFIAGIARECILDHAAGLHHQLGFASGAHSRHTAEVAQHRALTQRDRAGNGCVGGDDGVLHTGLVVD